MERGWVKLWRKTLDSAVWADENLYRLWVWCLLSANHTDGWVKVHGLAKPVLVKRGELMTGRYALNKGVYPKQRKKDPSAVTTWRWLRTLESIGNVSIQTNSRFTIVTICNYDTYNDVPETNDQQSVQPTCSRRAADVQPVITNKNDKNDKNEKNEEKEGCSERSANDSKPPVPADVPNDDFLIFPCSGKDTPTWTLTKAKVAEYAESFPGVDIKAECRKALQWCRDNKPKRKTVRGMPAFLARWLSREQDRCPRGTEPKPAFSSRGLDLGDRP